MTLVKPIMAKTAIFLNHLDDLARSGVEFTLDSLCINLTFDIIGECFPRKKPYHDWRATV